MKSAIQFARATGLVLRTAVAALVLGLVAGCGGGATQAPPAEDPSLADVDEGGGGDAVGASSPKVAKGIEAIQAGDFATAEGVLAEAREQNPDDPQAAFYLGVTYEGLEDFESAKKQYREALELDPNLADAAVNLSAVLLEQDQKPDSALRVVKLGLKSNPDHAGLLLNLALSQEMLGDWAGAAKAYAKLVKLAPKQAPLRLSYAIALHKSGDRDAALEQLAEAAKSDDIKVLAPTARLYGVLESFQRCVTTFNRALEQKQAPDLLVRRGLCKNAGGDPDGAIKDFQAALNMDADFAPAYLHLGLVFKEQDRKAEAKRALTDAIKHGEGTPIAAQAKKALAGL